MIRVTPVNKVRFDQKFKETKGISKVVIFLINISNVAYRSCHLIQIFLIELRVWMLYSKWISELTDITNLKNQSIKQNYNLWNLLIILFCLSEEAYVLLKLIQHKNNYKSWRKRDKVTGQILTLPICQRNAVVSSNNLNFQALIISWIEVVWRNTFAIGHTQG